MKKLCELVYDSIEDPKAWPEFLARFADKMHATVAFSFEPPKITGSFGVNPAWWKAYEARYHSVNPYLPYRFTAGKVSLSGEQLVTPILESTEFYNDWMRPQGWYHCTSVKFVAGAEHFFLVLSRPRRDGDFAPEVPLFENVARHVQRSYRIWTHIQDLEAKLDRLATRELDMRKLVSLYDLTPPEVRLVAAIFKGESVEMYAKQNNIPINTARWRVRQIYNKTGAKRQSELIKILTNAQAA